MCHDVSKTMKHLYTPGLVVNLFKMRVTYEDTIKATSEQIKVHLKGKQIKVFLSDVMVSPLRPKLFASEVKSYWSCTRPLPSPNIWGKAVWLCETNCLVLIVMWQYVGDEISACIAVAGSLPLQIATPSHINSYCIGRVQGLNIKYNSGAQ